MEACLESGRNPRSPSEQRRVTFSTRALLSQLSRSSYTLAVAALLVLSLATPGAIAPAHAANAFLVYAVLDGLTQEHVAGPDPGRLLAAALNGLRQALSRAAVAPTLADLTATGGPASRTEFQTRFDQAVAQAEGKITEIELQYAAARTMAASMDDCHTQFWTPEEYVVRRRALQSEAAFSGIGVSLIIKSGRTYVLRVFPGGPAALAGVQDFDRILAVDGRPAQSMATEEVPNLIRGQQGTLVTLTLQRHGQASPLTVSITRALTVPQVIAHRMLEGGVGYLLYAGFSRGSAAQFRTGLQALLQEQRARALVLDLRGNSGGWPDEGIPAVSMLLPAGLPIGILESRRGRTTQFTSGGTVLGPALPLILLVDGRTVSMGEQFSAAIQEHQRGTLIGTRTNGCLAATRNLDLPAGAAMLVSTARQLTGKGAVVDKVGVRPDVELDLTAEDLDRGLDAQLQRAVEIALQRRAGTTFSAVSAIN